MPFYATLEFANHPEGHMTMVYNETDDKLLGGRLARVVNILDMLFGVKTLQWPVLHFSHLAHDFGRNKNVTVAVYKTDSALLALRDMLSFAEQTEFKIWVPHVTLWGSHIPGALVVNELKYHWKPTLAE